MSEVNKNAKPKWVSFREDSDIIASLDRLAERQGIDRSGILRQTIRARLKAEVDAVYSKYK